jgi:hypothetical protein
MRHQAINVLDFGAKGDGIADDTAAINAAFAAMRDAAVNAYSTLRPQGVNTGEWFPGTCPAVEFPCGHYRISDAIDISGRFVSITDRDMGAFAIRGDNAVIRQTDPDKDILVSTYSSLTHVTGLRFLGGRHQVWLDNPNIGGFVKVTYCDFQETSGSAVVFGYTCSSTLAYLACCTFLDCEQWIYTMCDVATFRDVHGLTRAGMANKAAFDIRGGIVTMDNIMATPWCDAPDQRFIDNRCSALKLSNWRFGGEFGGFLPVRNFRKYSRSALGTSITIDTCLLPNQSNTKRPCVIYCDEVPNRIVVTNSTVLGIPVIMVDPRIDLKTYFKGVPEGCLKYAVENCTGQLGDMPEGLQNPVVVPAPGAVGLSDAALAQRFKEAAARAAKTPAWTGPPAAHGGHREQTDPANYVNLPGSQGRWTVEGHADAETTPNAKLYAVSECQDGVIVTPRHRDYGNGWALLQDVAIDVSRYPWLTYRVKPSDYGYLPCHLRVIDKESGSSLLCSSPGYAGGKDAPAYYAYDLRQAFGGGVRTFDIRVYVIGAMLCAKDGPEVAAARARGERRIDEVANPAESDVATMMAAGDKILLSLGTGAYTVLEYMRAEAE